MPKFKEIYFSSGTSELVVVESILSITGQDHLWRPNFFDFHLFELVDNFSGTPVTHYVDVDFSSLNIHAQGLLYNALYMDNQSVFSTPGMTFLGWSGSDVETAGLLVLQDIQLISIHYGRRKLKGIYLFQHRLVFTRRNGAQIIIVEKINTQDILLVVIRDRCQDSKALSIFWEDKSSDIPRARCAVVYFPDEATLVLWAGFLCVDKCGL